jgi:hypothetical protein
MMPGWASHCAYRAERRHDVSPAGAAGHDDRHEAEAYGREAFMAALSWH